MGGGERIENPPCEVTRQKIMKKVDYFEDAISKSEKSEYTTENDVTSSEVKTEIISIERRGKNGGMGSELTKTLEKKT